MEMYLPVPAKNLCDKQRSINGKQMASFMIGWESSAGKAGARRLFSHSIVLFSCRTSGGLLPLDFHASCFGCWFCFRFVGGPECDVFKPLLFCNFFILQCKYMIFGVNYPINRQNQNR